MRWDFSEEERIDTVITSEEFNQVCSAFLVKAIQSGDWYMWVAEISGSLASHMYLQLIHKVPRPGRSPDPYYGYVTNVYTRPAFRSLGIGSKMHKAMENWSKENGVEFLILRPSSESVKLYSRNGFSRCEEVLCAEYSRAYKDNVENYALFMSVLERKDKTDEDNKNAHIIIEKSRNQLEHLIHEIGERISKELNIEEVDL